MHIINDPQHADFRDRVKRLEAARTRGEGFETPDTIGRSAYGTGRTRRRAWAKPLMLALVGLLAAKTAIYAYIGPADYRERLAVLQSGNTVDQLGAVLMAPDPLTEWLASRLAAIIPTEPTTTDAEPDA